MSFENVQVDDNVTVTPHSYTGVVSEVYPDKAGNLQISVVGPEGLRYFTSNRNDLTINKLDLPNEPGSLVYVRKDSDTVASGYYHYLIGSWYSDKARR